MHFLKMYKVKSNQTRYQFKMKTLDPIIINTVSCSIIAWLLPDSNFFPLFPSGWRCCGFHLNEEVFSVTEESADGQHLIARLEYSTKQTQIYCLTDTQHVTVIAIIEYMILNHNYLWSTVDSLFYAST